MTLRGSTSDFPLESVIGLLAGTSKTGELQVRGDSKVGALGFASGRLVAAVMDGEGGENALGAIFAISQAEFEFTPWESAPEQNLEGGDLVSQLKRAAEARDRISAIRESIPDDRMRFRLSEKAADQGAVTFTPDRWRALLAVNGERDVAAIAEQLRLGKMQTLSLLSGLVKDGVIEALPHADDRPVEAPPAYSAPEPVAPQEPEPAPPAETWSPPAAQEEAPAPAREWSPPSSSAEPWGSEPEPAKEERAEPAQDWSTTAPDWAARESEAIAMSDVPATEPEVPQELQAEIAQRMDGFGPVPEPAAPDVAVPPAVDDRLASLSGLFAPGPAANAPAQQTPPAQAAEAKPKENDWWRAPGGGAPPQGAPAPGTPAESWMTAPPASKEAPSNAWAPTAKPKEPPADVNPWGAPAPQPESPAKDSARARADEWAPPAQPAVPDTTADKDKKKSGGFLSRFRKEETPTPIAHIPPASSAASPIGKLASLSNALLMEYNSGGYGKGKIETRLANLLMRVDEQADPIDRPLPVVDDLIDAAALEREGFDEQQAVPYLATLVRQIYEDAERAFGKDKAKKGYKAAQQQVFGGDVNALQSPELAGKLPKV
ncbi:MAG TPA: DUF4388 domain-containing protein [Candidatus Polarisedimenticolia bacterium]|nr:DUF4388 domain-containing protein [Candidatus Polarisedimenticolia bacterium]